MLYKGSSDEPQLFYRLFSPLIFEHYDRVIYLNNNVIINTDIAELYTIPFEGSSALAVSDSKSSNPRTFDSGVITFNLKKIREMNYSSTFLKLCGVVNLKQHDQDILNHVLCDDVLLISSSWNYQIYNDTNTKLSNDKIKIIHYCNNKPWENINACYAELWWRHTRNSPFYNDFIHNLKKKSLTCLRREPSDF